MKRLPAIFSLISPCDLFVDIGTDHGFIAGFAANICKNVIASDISEACLAKAKSNILAENVQFRVGDGLKVLDFDSDSKSDPDMVAICGMGGLTIISIMSGYEGKAQFILQPQSDVAAVRKFLSDSGYSFFQDFLCFERGKFYDILLVCKDKHPVVLDECALNFGANYRQKDIYLAQKLAKLHKEVSGYKPTPANIKRLELVNQALEYQQ